MENSHISSSISVENHMEMPGIVLENGKHRWNRQINLQKVLNSN